MSQVCCNEPITETDIIISSNKTQTLHLLLPQGEPHFRSLLFLGQGDAASLAWVSLLQMQTVLAHFTLLPLVK